MGDVDPALTEAMVEEEGDNDNACESFFLFDGRSPLDLPETWGETRDAFRDTCTENGFTTMACAGAEETVFHGYPQDQGHLQVVVIDGTLCERLVNHAAAVSEAGFPPLRPDVVPLKPVSLPIEVALPSMARRTKGTWGGSGWSYGPARGSMNSRYPRGWGRPSYGYTGFMGRAGRGVRFAVPAVAAGVGVGYLYSRYHTYCGGSECRAGQEVHPQGDFYRDDLMDSGFWPSDFAWPLTLVISKVDGVDFVPSKICPPPNWPEHSTTWTAPATDIFFALTKAENIEPSFRLDWTPNFMWVILIGFFSIWNGIMAFFFCSARICGESPFNYLKEDKYGQACLKLCLYLLCPHVLAGIAIPFLF